MDKVKYSALLLLISLPLFAYPVQVGGGSGYRCEVVADYGDRVVMEVEVSSFEVEQFGINGEIFDWVIMSGEAYHREAGYPELPTLRRSIIIPDRGALEVDIVEAEYEEIPMVNRVIPSRGNIQRSEDPSSIPYTFEGYDRSGYYPEEEVRLYDPYILRDYRGVTVEVNPLRYDPQEGVLKVIKRMVVEVRVNQTEQGVNELWRGLKPTSLEESYQGIYRDHFINFNSGRYTAIPEPGRALIITYDAFHSSVEPLKEWKLQKGTECEIIDFSTIGTTNTQLANYLDSVYHSADPVTYVILVGDVAQIPTLPGTYSSSIDSDTRYALVEGNDLYADFFISRISASSVDQVNIQVTKVIHYEKDIQDYTSGNTAWLGKAVGIGSNDTGGTGIPDWQRMDWLRDSLMNIGGYTDVDQIYAPGATASQVTTAVNAGRGIINYIGHGSGTSWSTTGFSVSNIHQLDNPWMLPFIEDVACDNGDYSMSECFGEAWLRAGDVTNPDGGIAYHGASTGASWVPPCDMQSHFVHLIVRQEKLTFGGLYFGGEMQALDLYPGTGGEGHKIVDQYNIMGDCEAYARTAPQQIPTVNHVGTMFLGNSTYDVQVTGEEGARCALYHNDTIYGVGYTNGAGQVTINLDYPVLNPTDLLLTVTGLNLQTYQDTVNAIPASGAYITFAYIDDITGGHSNGQLNSGCSYDLLAAITNVGTITADNVEGIITSTDGNITMEYDTVDYGNIAAGDTVIGGAPHGFQLGSGIPDGYIIPVDMTCWDNNDSSWTSSFSLTVNAPVVEVIGYWGPEEITAGDAFDLGIKLYNGGTGTGFNANAGISSTDAYITINDSAVGIGNIAAGDTFFDPAAFNITVDPNCPDPHFAEIVMTVSMDGGYQLCDTMSIGIGSMIFVEDFEDKDTAEWTYEGTYSWHVSTRRAHSTTHSMYCGDENTGIHANGLANVRAVSPVFYVGSGTEMTFWHWYNTFETWDGTQLQLTTDGGSTWTTIETDEGYTSVNGGSGNGYSVGDPYWAGTHEAWEIQHYTFTITDSVQLGWRFGSTSVVAYEGYYFDDINCGVSSGLGVEEEEAGPPQVNSYQYRLAPAYPNPMQGHAVISYSVASEGPVNIKIYDISGREVHTLINQVQGPGSYRIEWDGRDNHGTMVSSGTYFYRMVSGNFSDGKKLVVVR